MSLRDYGHVVWRRKWWVVVSLVLAAAFSLVQSATTTPMYRATASVLVRLPPTANSVGETGVVMSPRLVKNELETAAGSELRSEVREIIGSGPELSVQRTADDSDVFEFQAVSDTAQTAADAANAYAEQYIARQREGLLAEFASRAAAVQQQLDGIEAGADDAGRGDLYRRQLEELELSATLAETSGATLIDRATPPGSPFEPRPLRSLALALVVGALIGLGVAFLRDYLDRTIRDEDELERITGLPNLAMVPHDPTPVSDLGRAVTVDEPKSAHAEAYRNLRTSLQFLSVDEVIRTVQVTSSRPGEGKTTTAGNLAVVAANSGQRVLLVDCDLRKPQIHQMFGLSNDQGLTSVLLGEVMVQDVAQRVEGVDGLRVVTSGPVPPNPSELLGSDVARLVFESVAEKCDLVIIDSPPVIAVADALVLTAHADAVVVVVSGKSTDSRSLGRALARLGQADASVVGTLFNDHEGDGVNAYSYGYAAPAK
jgi:succinoglycan biosynthesis transport protein ExoP